MERRAIEVYGIVQGVGFRPFVFNLAVRLRLGGFVKNQMGNVLIEIEGDPASLDCFLAELTGNAPPLAQVEHLSWEPRTPRGEQQFHIEVSAPDTAGPVFVSPDGSGHLSRLVLLELFDPKDRRFGYPFLNCTNCGPRLTIITGAPYDRSRTTMASFAMCPACRAEYEDSTNRRFHAQPIACPACGPRLELRGAGGVPVETEDAVATFLGARLHAGAIGALKGLGGYHLTCDARNQAAVAELRRRKHRDEKPFAVMVRDVAAAEAHCEMREEERELLLSPHRPIVLLCHRTVPYAVIAEEVAPGNPWLGVMLPYTPLHHLLLQRAGEMPLVMTSGNRSDEPIAYRDDEALLKLSGVSQTGISFTIARSMCAAMTPSPVSSMGWNCRYGVPAAALRGRSRCPWSARDQSWPWADNSKERLPWAAVTRPFSATTWATWITTRLTAPSSGTCVFLKSSSPSGLSIWFTICIPITPPLATLRSGLEPKEVSFSPFSIIMLTLPVAWLNMGSPGP